MTATPLAIAAHGFSVPSETYIRNHAQTVLPGGTVFVSSEQSEDFDFPGPVLRGVPALRRTAGRGLFRLTGAASERYRRLTLSMSREDERRLEAFLRNHGVTTVLTEFLNHGVHLGAILKKLDIKHFSYCHGYDIDRLATEVSWRSAYRRLFKVAEGFLCSSDYTRSVLRNLGAPDEKIILSALGIPADFFESPTKPPEEKRVVSVCRLIPWKGVDVILRAMARVLEDDPHVHYDIVGDGPERAMLERLAKDLGISGAVTFHGMVKPSRVRDLVDGASVFIQHSVTIPGLGRETFGLSVIEAMARARSVIVSRHGGMAETVIHGETGFHVAERDVDGLADALGRLLSDREMLHAFGAAGRARAERLYTSEAAAARLRRALNLENAETARGSSASVLTVHGTPA